MRRVAAQRQGRLREAEKSLYAGAEGGAATFRRAESARRRQGAARPDGRSPSADRRRCQDQSARVPTPGSISARCCTRSSATPRRSTASTRRCALAPRRPARAFSISTPTRCSSLGRAEEALAASSECWRAMPRHGEARLNRGVAHGEPRPHRTRRSPISMPRLRSCPVIRARTIIAASRCYELGRYAEAIAAFDRALAAAPAHAQRLATIAGARCRRSTGSPRRWQASTRPIAPHKDYADAHFNGALALLTLGDYRARL